MNKGIMKEIHSYLGSDVEIEGKVICDGPVRVDGACQGVIDGKGSVTVGISGQISGTLRAESMVINGQVNGDLITSGTVAVLSEGNIVGKIFTPAGQVTITKGGNFKGSFYTGQLPELPSVENPRISEDVIKGEMLSQTPPVSSNNSDSVSV